LRIALRIESPSLEAELVESVLVEFGSVEILDPWDTRSFTETYDVALCAGPVTSCPYAKRRILLVLGPTHLHRDFGWDDVVVTSPRAQRNAMWKFNHGTRFYMHSPPLLNLEAGRLRLMERKVDGLCAAPCGPHVRWPATSMALWSLPSEGDIPFSAMQFNSLCLNGAYGIYRGMGDGYDVQVRRHLALGSPVVLGCRDADAIAVLGEDLADVCLDGFDGHSIPVEPVEDKVSVEGYKEALREIIRRK